MNTTTKKETKNAAWLIGGKIIQMVIGLVVSTITTRYLGPSNFGTLNYIAAYINLFTCFCSLGINSVILKEFVEKPEKEGTILGTSIVMRIVSSILSIIMISTIVLLVDKTIDMVIIAVLSGLALLFQAGETINYWFQNKYLSKITAISTLIAYLIVVAYRVVILATRQSIFWFAFASSLDYACIGICLFIFYKSFKGPKLSFSWKEGRNILKKSYNYILSGAMVALYSQTDKIMLKFMLSETEVGYYSTAFTLCTLWVFVLTAIIDSMSPTIISSFKNNYSFYEEKNVQLYSIVFYLSLLVSLAFVFFGDIVIRLMYGDEFMPSSIVLKVITWYTSFAYLGVARNAWIVCENKQKFLKYIYLFAALLNIGLNFALIPVLGGVGASLASVITQLFTCIILPLCFKGLRRNVYLMIKGVAYPGILLKNRIKQRHA